MSRHRTSSRCPQGNGPCHRLSVTLEGFFCFLFLDAHGCRYRLWSKAIWYEFQNNRSPLKGYGSVTIQKLRLTTDKLLSVDGNSVLALQSGWITEISSLKSMQIHFEKLQSFSDGQNMSGPISVLWEDRGGSETGSDCKLVSVDAAVWSQTQFSSTLPSIVAHHLEVALLKCCSRPNRKLFAISTWLYSIFHIPYSVWHVRLALF